MEKLVDTLDQDLDLDDDGNEEGKKSEEKKIVKNKFSNALKIKTDDEDDDDDQVITDTSDAAKEDATEDVKEEDKEVKPAETNESETKLAGAVSQDDVVTQDETVAEPPAPPKRQNYPLMDQLCSFLYEDEAPLPILCGYFSKII